MPKRPIALTLLVLLTFTVIGCTGGCEPKRRVTRVDDGTPHVRVRLLAGVTRVTLRPDRPTRVGYADSGGFDLDADRNSDLEFDGRTWTCNGRTITDAGPLTAEPPPDGLLSVNGKPYRGTFQIQSAGSSKFDVVNDIDVESYLQGVLAKELLPDWHPEAYRAQAVIARTYALYEVRTNPPGRYWDLFPDERSQVYGGVAAENAKANEAVEATRGMVVAFGPSGDERIFKAYFSSCCGGATASAADVFNEPAIPPLAAHSNGTTCSISTRFNWPAVTLSKAELTRRFRVWGTRNGRPEAKLLGVKAIDIGSVNAFDRPRNYLLTDTRGQQYALTAEQLRWAINSDPNGGPTVFSGFFKPVDTGDSIRFTEGHGFGHGVGACQWCMQARALAGLPFAQIVMQAYPQSVLVPAYK